MKELLVGKIHRHFSPISCFATMYTGYCQRALVGESGMIKTQMGKQNISVMVAVYGTP
jgi:hypothetical protein